MEGRQYAAISGYLEHETYPAVFTKSHKFVLRRSCKNYKLVKGKLYYKEQIQDGTDCDRLVVKRSEADRAFLECHLTAGEHRAMDASYCSESERYYWPNFFITSSNYFYLEHNYIDKLIRTCSYIHSYSYSSYIQCRLAIAVTFHWTRLFYKVFSFLKVYTFNRFSATCYILRVDLDVHS